MRGICAEAGCPHPPTYRGRCREHARRHNAATSPNRRIYGRKKWQILRRAYLHDHPLCEHPDCNEIATDVHHRQAIGNGGDPWSMDNLEALCHACHSQQTRREQQGVGAGRNAQPEIPSTAG